MTRDEYKASLAEYTAREVAAQADIKTLDASIASLKAQIDAVQAVIDRVERETLALTGATEAEVKAYGERVDALLRQLQGLAALAPEELQHRRAELKSVAMELAALRKSKISWLPEMTAKLMRASKMIDDLMMRAPEQITYDVKKGDHLWGIASKPEVYDDPYMWPRIYRANRDKIKDPDLIYPKQMLMVPIAVGENQYLVTSGDFLSKIASAVYNDPTMWHKIYKANAEQIVEPNLVFPAQVLEIPTK
ncbi:MAG: LysM peptidoglycan-binding domain-containing protein [bacterium]|nr:LysM peptidoglycan-binding domain-containing protein [bacterium]